MNSETYKPGTRIYYTGDQANHDSYGTIINFRPPNKWGGVSVDISFDDERFDGDTDRLSMGIHLLGFKEGPGRRFWLAEDWKAEREKSMAKMQEFLASRT